MPTVETTVVDFSQLLLAEQPTGAAAVLAANGTIMFARGDGSAYQALGPNLIPANAAYNDFAKFTLTVIPGHYYQWTGIGPNELAVACGVYASAPVSPGITVSFEAPSAEVLFFGFTPNAPITFFFVDLTVAFDNLNATGTITTPPLFLYCNSRIVAYGQAGTNTSLPLALTQWTDYGNTPAQQEVDVTPIPTLVFDGTLTVPCLGENGAVEFQNSGTLLPGNYQLTVQSGNIGMPDPDFNGFDVQITLDAVVLQETLLKGQSGYNVQGFDQFEFVVVDPLIGNFLLSFLWTNEYSNPATGQERQLAIYSYALRRQAAEVFRVDIAGTGYFPLLTPLDNTNYLSGTTPGGWVLALNSYGTLAAFAHESLIYSANDTITSNTPISGVYTGLTPEKREDLIFPTTEVVVSDAGSFTYPTFGAISSFLIA